MLFLTGIYLGRRISDITSPKGEGRQGPRSMYNFRESKKNKEAYLKINKKLKKVFKDYCADMDGEDYLFPPLKGSRDRHITRQQYWNILNRAASQIGYRDKIGCHSLRKTLGHELYSSGVDITMIMLVLNQDDVNYTKKIYRSYSR